MSATARICRCGKQAVQKATNNETAMDVPGVRDGAYAPSIRL
jgi:hypothetical protein